MSTFRERIKLKIVEAKGDDIKVAMATAILEAYDKGYNDCEVDNGLFPNKTT